MGVEANERLTATTALILLILLAVEGVTVLQVRPLLTMHVFVGMLLVPPVLVKLSSTLWRFAKYYLGAPDYREKGPPPTALRVLGPFVALLTIVMFASGIVLLLGPANLRGQMLTIHKVSFFLWFVFMTVHVLGHLGDTARLATRDWTSRARSVVAGSRTRQVVLVASLAVGLLLAFVTIPHVGSWTFGH
ncbi:MAG TPA: hypothetical protein VGZ68_00920 [Acidimicrobiales bacterium]|jgi:hypothetical protein|nr:hypothetical protein [Acidimicrobiales bacterium]